MRFKVNPSLRSTALPLYGERMRTILFRGTKGTMSSSSTAPPGSVTWIRGARSTGGMPSCTTVTPLRFSLRPAPKNWQSYPVRMLTVWPLPDWSCTSSDSG